MTTDSLHSIKIKLSNDYESVYTTTKPLLVNGCCPVKLQRFIVHCFHDVGVGVGVKYKLAQQDLQKKM